MQRKRFKLVKDNDSVRPLHPISTNVKLPPIETRVKQPLKRSINQSSHPIKRRRRERFPEARTETVFENDDVQLKLGDISPRRPVSPHQRLCRTEESEEEGDSLQFEDFDQPPESTSTPLNGGKDLGFIDGNLADNLPFSNNAWQQPHLQQLQQQTISYMPFGIIPSPLQYPSAVPSGYPQGIVPIPVQTVGSPMGGQFPIPMGFPMGYPIAQSAMVEPYPGNYIYGPESQNSYKSSGGYATYKESDDSFGG